MVGLIFMLLLMLTMWTLVFVVFLQDGNNATSEKEMTHTFIVVTIVVFLSIITFFGVAHKGFSVFEISEKGVKTSLFKIFRKREISWDEMYEIRCYGMITQWLFFSKTNLEDMHYNDIIKRKDVLQIQCSKEIIDLIRTYTDKEIVNLSKE